MLEMPGWKVDQESNLLSIRLQVKQEKGAMRQLLI